MTASDRILGEDIRSVLSCRCDWSVLDGATVGVTGATGMVGAVLVGSLLAAASEGLADTRVVAVGRSAEKACGRLRLGDPRLAFVEADVSVPGNIPPVPADYVVHLASPTHPAAYATEPIGTIMANVEGTRNALEWQLATGSGGTTLLASSVEVYGEALPGQERFSEGDVGFIDCNTLRAGYPEGKRLSEALCQAYATERGARVRVARLPRLYGPTLLPSDTKALSQFLFRAAAGEDVVLKSDGSQRYSYLYSADAVSGLLWVLTRGQDGEAYNVADEASDTTLRELAELVAHGAGVGVSFGEAGAVERAGHSAATRALLDGSKLQSLGWKAKYELQDGISRTMLALGM